MPKFNPIFTFSKINLKLTKKSSRFIFSNYFIKKLLEFYIVSSHRLYFIPILEALQLSFVTKIKRKRNQSLPFAYICKALG